MILPRKQWLLAAWMLLAAAFVSCTKTGLERASEESEGCVLVRISAGGVDNGLCAAAGSWYRLHPDGMVTESGALTLTAGGWACGAE